MRCYKIVKRPCRVRPRNMTRTRCTYLISCIILLATASNALEQRELQTVAQKLGLGGLANGFHGTTQPLQQPGSVSEALQRRGLKSDGTRVKSNACNVKRMSTLCSAAVTFFSKLFYFIFGYFDPTNNFFDNKNKWFLG